MIRVGINGRVLRRPTTGIERVARELIWALRGRADVAVVVLDPGRRLRGGRALLWDLWGVGKLAQRSGCDVILAPAFVHPYASFKSCIVLVHDLLFYSSPEYFSWRQRVYLKFTVRIALHNRRCTVAVPTRAVFDVVRKRFPALDGRIFVVHHGVHSKVIEAPVAAIGDELIVTCLGAITKRKRWHVIAEAVQELRREGMGVRAIVMGRAQEADYAALLNQYDGTTVLVGPSDAEVEEVTSKADVVAAYPSLDEGFGLPLLESMASGIPILAADTDVFREVCGRSARYVGQGVAHWKEAIRMVADPTLRGRMSTDGLQIARAFNWTASAEEYVKIARTVL